MPDFAASADASVSFDGESVLFAGKKTAGDKWQIWEMTLADRKVRQVVASGDDAIRPLYLPGWRLVYAQRTEQGFQLESARLMESKALADIEGAGAKAVFPLTYMNAGAMPADVLADGRILFEAEFPLGAGATPELFLVYSDGSGVESYRCDHPANAAGARWGGRQLKSGDVVFTHGGSLARFSSPLAHEEQDRSSARRVCGRIAETAIGGMAGERARFGERNVRAEALEAGCGDDADGAGAERREPGRAGGSGVRTIGRSGILRGCMTGTMRTCWRWMRGFRAMAI